MVLQVDALVAQDVLVLLGDADHLCSVSTRHCANRRRAQLGLASVFKETENPFPWMSEAMDIKKEKNFLETRVIEYQNVGALSLD